MLAAARAGVFLALLLALPGSSLCLESQLVTPVRMDSASSFLQRARQQDVGEGSAAFLIRAFDQEFNLNLVADSSFLAPGFTVQALSGSPRAAWGATLSHCFYSGSVNGEPGSFAALSLCDGMHGAFRSNGTEYLIQPVGNDSRSPPGAQAHSTHLLRRRSAAASSLNATSRCGVSGTFANMEVLEKFKASHTMDPTPKVELVGKKASRSKRFASIPRFVETLVVADESMATFHGDDLKHYVLMLMAVAARLYKHPSILNPVSIVVVKFMVINHEDKGPKISSNAALTLRNFCAWQKKFNKANDKNPEYYDTAVLFTKQIFLHCDME